MTGGSALIRALIATDQVEMSSIGGLFVLLICMGLVYLASSLCAGRYVKGHYYAALMFGAQLFLSFLLEIIYVTSSLWDSGFWAFLLLTSLYHSLRNMGYVEDILEWFRIRYQDSLIYNAFETCYYILDYRMWTSGHASNVPENSTTSTRLVTARDDIRIMFLIKTQGDLLEMGTPLMLLAALLVDVLFVDYLGGTGTFTIGFTRTARAHAFLIYIVTFSAKVVTYILSATVLQYKRRVLTQQLMQMKSIETSHYNDSQLREYKSKLRYVTVRVQIAKVYLMSLLLEVGEHHYDPKGNRGSTVIGTEKDVALAFTVERETDVGIGDAVVMFEPLEEEDGMSHTVGDGKEADISDRLDLKNVRDDLILEDWENDATPPPKQRVEEDLVLLDTTEEHKRTYKTDGWTDNHVSAMVKERLPVADKKEVELSGHITTKRPSVVPVCAFEDPENANDDVLFVQDKEENVDKPTQPEGYAPMLPDDAGLTTADLVDYIGSHEQANAMRYSAVFLKYLKFHYLYFFSVCSFFFFYSYFGGTSLRIEEGHAAQYGNPGYVGDTR